MEIKITQWRVFELKTTLSSMSNDGHTSTKLAQGFDSFSGTHSGQVGVADRVNTPKMDRCSQTVFLHKAVSVTALYFITPVKEDTYPKLLLLSNCTASERNVTKLLT